MSGNISSPRPLYKQLFDVQSVIFYLLVLACLLSAAFAFIFWADGWSLWFLGFLIIAAWMPLIFSTMRTIFLQDRWLAFLYLMVIAQAAHTIEHLAQMIELHTLGWPASKAKGILGFLDIEWVHLIWNSWVLLAVVMLLFAYRRNAWLWFLCIFAIYHEIEHIYIVSIYVRTGVAGNPGLLAKGGLIGGGLPIIRPDLHALYAVLEISLLLIIYFIERRKSRQAQIQLASAV
jgi:hypothetical protein